MHNTQIKIVYVKFSSDRIPVSLAFEERRRLSITVHPDGCVSAVAPINTPLTDIMKRLQRRRSWIAKQQRFFSKFHPIPVKKRYTSGETHLYLGRQYRLRVHSSDTEPCVKLVGRFLNVFVSDPQEPSIVRKSLDSWYRDHANPIFERGLTRCLESAKFTRLREPKLQIRQMRRRWGSCSSAGMITLNLELIKAPVHCIEYVIMHELCHLRVHDHSNKFYRLLGRCMPDWKQRKERLDLIVLR